MHYPSCENEVMPKRSRRKRGRDERVVVVLEYAPAPDAEERLRRVFDLILRAAARSRKSRAEERESIEDDHHGEVGHGG